MAFGIDQPTIDQRIADLQTLSDDDLAALAEEINNEQELPDGHLVEYAEACCRQDLEENQQRHDLDELLWEAHESQQREFHQKDQWQAKITTNEPFQVAMQAKALVRQAVIDKADWFDIEAQDTGERLPKLKAAFWKDALKYWTKKASFLDLYPDMTEMSFATGISLASKAIWKVDGEGNESLKLARIAPWKIRRDPDAIAREPQGGLFCIHEDWIDYHLLKEGEAAGRYENVSDVLRDVPDEYSTDQSKERRRRGLRTMSRNRFRKQVLVREIWGDVLDQNGELALSSVRYTIANRTVIKRPVEVPFPTLRWPIHQFASLPHLINFHGYSLIEGMLKMWKLRNNLLCMTADQLSFILNSAWEVDAHKLANPGDTELFPGAFKFKKPNQQGAAYTPIQTNKDFLPALQELMVITGNLFQNGTFVTELLKGEIGNRRDITKGEVEIKTQQALGVFQSIGIDTEKGGVEQLKLIQEVLTTFWDPNDHPSYAQILGPKHALLLSFLEGLSAEDRITLMKQETDISIRGISLLLEKSDLLKKVMGFAQISAQPQFQGFWKPYDTYVKLAGAFDMDDCVKSEDELQQEMTAGPTMPGQPSHGSPGVIPPGHQPGQTGQALAEAASARALHQTKPAGGGAQHLSPSPPRPVPAPVSAATGAQPA